MNVHELEVGNIYKNYKELCITLNQKQLAGNSRKAQLKEWERYFNYEKKGHKFIITEIFDLPKQRNDLRSIGNNTTPYIGCIEKLLLDLLVQDSNEGRIFLSRNKLLRELQMINDNYTYGKYKPVKLSKFMKITKEEINDFYNSSESLLKRNLEAAMNNLKKELLIFWNHAITVCYIDTQIETNEFDRVKIFKREEISSDGEYEVSYDTFSPQYKEVHREATKEETRLIMYTQKEVLKEYQCKEIADLYKIGKADSFYKRVSEILLEEANISYFYNSYEILCNEEHILEKWKELEELQLSNKDKVHNQNELNHKIVSKLNDNAITRHDKAAKQMKEEFSEYNKDIIKLRSTKQYIVNSVKLTETLIDKNMTDIRKVINEHYKAK